MGVVGISSGSRQTPSLDPLLIDLGCAIGLLQQSGLTVSINSGWFNSPHSYLKSIATNPAQSTALQSLLDGVLGAIPAAGLGAPGGSLGGTWHPLSAPGGTSAAGTGFYLVYDDSGAVPVYGLGFLSENQGKSLTLTPYAVVPLVSVSTTGCACVLGEAGHPLQFGVMVDAASGSFGHAPVSFDGVKFAVAMDVSNGLTVDLDILNLTAPGLPGGDISIAGSAGQQLSVDEWVSLVLGLLAGQAGRDPGASSFYDLLVLLGATGQLPSPDWAALWSAPEKALNSWLGTLCSTQGALPALLNALFCLANGTIPAADGSDVSANVQGGGTPASPYAITLYADSSLTLTLTLAATGSGARTVLCPGLQVVPAALAPLTGHPDVTVQLLASVELAEIALGTEAPAVTPFPTFGVHLQAANGTAGGALFASDAITIGSARAGIVSTAASGGKRTIAPDFALLNVASGSGFWPSIDLSNWQEQLADVAADAASAAVSSYFSAHPALQDLAVALGFAAPPGAPADYPLIVGDDAALLLHAPLTALGAYYTALITTGPPTTSPCIIDALPHLAAYLSGQSAGGLAVSGSGTAAAPWQVPLDAGGTAVLRAFTAAGPVGGGSVGGPVLTLGLGLSLGGAATSGVVPTLTAGIDLVAIALPNAQGNGAGAPVWLPGITAGVTLTGADGGTLQLPAIAGLTLGAADFAAGFQWCGAFSWYAALDAVTVTNGDSRITVGDLRIGEGGQQSVPTDLTADLDTLATLGVTTTGLALLTDGGRVGSFAATALGLLPNLPALYSGGGSPGVALPAGITLPAGWPTLPAGAALLSTGLPSALQTQLAALFAPGSAFAATAMRILGWALTGTVPASGGGAGTCDDPWTAPLGFAGLSLEAFSTGGSAGAGVGVGVGAVLAQETVAGVTAELTARLIPGVMPSFGGGPAVGSAGLPSLTLQCSLTSATSGEPLVGGGTDDELTVGTAALGVTLMTGGTGLRITPVLTLTGACTGAGCTPATVTLSPGASGSAYAAEGLAQAAFETLLNAVVVALSEAAPGSRVIGPILGLLADLSILQAPEATSGAYGINAGSWSALLADPGGFLAAQAEAVAGSPPLVASAGRSLLALLGIEPPGGWTWGAIPDVLAALGLMRAAPGGFVPVPSAWLGLVENPAAYLTAQATALFAEADAAVTGAIAAIGTKGLPALTVTLGDFVLAASTPGAGRAVLSLTGTVDDADGPVLGATLSLDADFADGALSASLAVDVPALAQSLVFAVGNGTTPFTVTAGGNGAVAAFAPLTLHPPAGMAPVGELAERIALALLAQGAGQLLTREALPSSPAVASLLTGLGLTRGTGAAMRVTSLLPALLHPVDWVLSPQALGTADGGLNLSAAGTLLQAIPGSGITGPGGLTLTGVGGGLSLGGLPFGVSATLSAAGSGLSLTLGASPTVEGLTLSLQGGIAYAPGSGIGLTTGLSLSDPLPNGTLGIDARYASGAGFTLDLDVPTGAAQPAQVALVPYPGFNAVAQSFGSAAAGALLEDVATKLSAAYASWLAGTPDARLKSVLAQLRAVGNALGITSVATLVSTVEAIAADGTSVFAGWIGPANGAALMGELGQLIKSDLGFAGLQVQASPAGLSYPLTATVDGTITAAATIAFGQTDAAGGGFSLSVTGSIGISLLTVRADAAVTYALSSGAFAVALDSGVTADLAKVGATPLPYAPALSLNVGYGSDGAELGVSLETTNPPASLSVAVLPSVTLLSGTTPVPSFTGWLEDLLLRVVLPSAANTLLAESDVAAFLGTTIGTSPATVGSVLAAAGILQAVPATPVAYTLSPGIATLGQAPLVTILTDGLKAILSTGTTVPLLSLGGKGSVSLTEADGRIGIALVLTGLTLESSPTRTVTLQLGNWLTGDTGADNWVTRAGATGAGPLDTPGLTLYLLNTATQPPSFQFGLDLVSAGIDIAGTAAAPLLSAGGGTLDGIELRFALSLTDDPAGVVLGGGVRADNVGLPLGPALGASSGASNNAVAQSLLSPQSGSAGSGAVNPPFSAALSYLSSNGTPAIAFYDASGALESNLTIPVQRSFGPLHCSSLGLGSSGDTLQIGFTGAVALDVLNISLSGLSVGIPLGAPLDSSSYALSLQGLDVSLGGGGFTVGGALLESTDPLEYTGEITVSGPGLTLAGVGSFAELNGGTPSLFAFAQYTPAVPLGGPPFFFVQGFAGGFGFNRSLAIPAVQGVSSFPLVSLASSQTAQTPDAALAALEDVAPIEAGEYWLAAGVTFSTFEFMSTDAVLAVSFGDEVAIDLVGYSTLALPRDGSPWVQADMGLEVSFLPSEGTLQAMAELTPSSYLFSQDCALTGGFAFYAWFSGPHSGEFVVTLGGYNPSFTPPSYYPQVPRLGISWQPGDGVSITGDAYFALTPALLMAGGALSVSYQSDGGDLQAWFSAYADLLIRWSPFAYEVDVGVSLGASYTGHTLFTWTISIELSADVTLWGPPFAAVAHVRWAIISFTVDIGDTSNPPLSASLGPPMAWTDFAAAFLPQPGGILSMVRFRPAAGLLSQGSGWWVVDADQFELAIDLSAPTSTVSVGAAAGSLDGVTATVGFPGPSIGVPNVGLYDLSPEVSLTITGNGAHLQVAAVTSNVPANLWGRTPIADLTASPSNAAATLAGAVTGLLVCGNPAAPDVGPQRAGPLIALGALMSEPLGSAAVTVPSGVLTGQPASAGTSIPTIMDSVMAPATVAARQGIVAAAAALTGFDLTAGGLAILAAEAGSLLQEDPLLGALGSFPPPDAASLTAASASTGASTGASTAATAPASAGAIA